MSDLLLLAGVAILVSAGLAALLNRFWPRTPAIRLVLIAGGVLPLTLLLLFASIALNPPPRDPHGLVYATAVLIGPIMSALTFALSVASASATVHFLRRGLDR